jgi:hypothetical protein
VRQFAFSVRPAQTLLRVGAWLLPWLVVLVVSCGLAYAADVELVQAWSAVPSPPTTPATQTTAFTSEPQPWVLIEAVGEDGTRYQLECLARPGRFTTEVVVLEVSELDMVTAASCEQLQPIQQH